MKREFEKKEGTAVSGLHQLDSRGPKLFDSPGDIALEDLDDEEILELLIESAPLTDEVKAAAYRFDREQRADLEATDMAEVASPGVKLRILIVAKNRKKAMDEQYLFFTGLEMLPLPGYDSGWLMWDIADFRELPRKLLAFGPDIVHFCGHGETEESLNCFRDSLTEAIDQLLGILKYEILSVSLVTYHGDLAPGLLDWIGGDLTSIGCFLGLAGEVHPATATVFIGYLYQEMSLGNTLGHAFTMAKNAAPLSDWPSNNHSVCLRPVKLEPDALQLCHPDGVDFFGSTVDGHRSLLAGSGDGSRPYTSPRSPELLWTILDSGYHLDGGDRQWLLGILRAIQPIAHPGFPPQGFFYDALGSEPRVWDHEVAAARDAGIDRLIWESFHPLLIPLLEALRRSPRSCGTLRQLGLEPNPSMAGFGVQDAIYLNINSQGPIGCCLLIPLENALELSAEASCSESWAGVMSHIGTSLDLRWSLTRLIKECAAIPGLDIRQALHYISTEYMAAGQVECASDQIWSWLTRGVFTFIDSFRLDEEMYAVFLLSPEDTRRAIQLTPLEQEILLYRVTGQVSSQGLATAMGRTEAEVVETVQCAMSKLRIHDEKLLAKILYRRWMTCPREQWMHACTTSNLLGDTRRGILAERLFVLRSAVDPTEMAAAPPSFDNAEPNRVGRKLLAYKERGRPKATSN